jgi:hypothetical protein
MEMATVSAHACAFPGCRRAPGVALKACRGCGETYCSPGCARAHWPVHKGACREGKPGSAHLAAAPLSWRLLSSSAGACEPRTLLVSSGEVVRATCADVRIARGFARGRAVMDAFAMALRLMRLSDGHWVWSLPMPPLYRDAFTRGLNCGEGAAAQLARFGGAERATRALCIAALHMVSSVEVFVDAGSG